MSKNTRTRIILTAVAALLLVTMAVGGTLAWLQAETNTVSNTFATSAISVLLQEHEHTGKDENKDNITDLTTTVKNTNDNYKFVPGMNLAKDPTLSASSDVDYWVFVKVDIDNWPTAITAISYELAIKGWSKFELEDGSTVYWIAKNAGETIEDMALIVDNTIYVDDDLSKEDLATITTAPTMVFDAYASQQYGFDDPEDAWTTLWAQSEGAIKTN